MAESALTCTLASIGAGAGRVAARVDNSGGNEKRVIRFNVRIKSGGVAPTAGEEYKFFLHRQDAEGTNHSDDTVGSADAAVSVLPDNSYLAGTIVLTGDAATDFETSFIVYEPGPYWSLSFWNASAAAISSTESDHYLRYRYIQ